jgi:hypothetical protein
MTKTRRVRHRRARSVGCILMTVVSACLLLVSASTASAQQSASGRKPNILVIWGDDIGYWNISAYNQGMMGYKSPSLTRGRTEFTYISEMVRIPEGSAPDVKNKSFSISADVDIPANGANGVLVTQGGRFCGWVLLVLDGKPVFVHGLSNQTQHK